MHKYTKMKLDPHLLKKATQAWSKPKFNAWDYKTAGWKYQTIFQVIGIGVDFLDNILKAQVKTVT